jgi:heme-degrading monooxygenase HmoA
MINVFQIFTVKSGKLDEFVQAQTAAFKKLGENMHGVKANRFYRGITENKAVNLAYFADKKSWNDSKNSKAYKEFLDHVSPMLEREPEFIIADAVFSSADFERATENMEVELEIPAGERHIA